MEMLDKVSVLGAGSWGTALANVLADNGKEVLLWTQSQDHADEIANKRTNSKYLPDFKIQEGISVTTSLEEVSNFSNILLFVIPTAGIRSVAEEIKQYFTEKKVIIHASKGLERSTHKRISEVLSEVIPSDSRYEIAVLSGPSHAEEVVKKDLTSITSASQDEQVAKYVQELFINDYFRIYTSTDVIGVEMGAALKNIIAVCSGALKGRGFGDNARAALITRGLAEMTRLGVELGGKAETFSGLSGVGDLIVTCSSEHSRNFNAGVKLGSGMGVEQAMDEIGMVVEGIFTAQVAHELAGKHGIEMPITEALYKVIYDKSVTTDEAIQGLMEREGKAEML